MGGLPSYNKQHKCAARDDLWLLKRQKQQYKQNKSKFIMKKDSVICLTTGQDNNHNIKWPLLHIWPLKLETLIVTCMFSTMDRFHHVHVTQAEIDLSIRAPHSIGNAGWHC